MIVYFLRHGETELNRQNIVQGSGMDSDLNELGRAQALAFFEAHQMFDFELIVTSKLKRTRQTVQKFIDLNIPWIEMEELNEISWGIHEGSSPNAERHRDFMELIENWKAGNLDAAMRNGESAAQLQTRLQRFLDWLQNRPEKRILVATHGRTLRALIAMLKGLGLQNMELVPHVNTGCYVVGFNEEGVEFHKENDTAHLKKAQLQVIQPT
jgi:probable phosphoglycerate mutase